jgi:chemotaxis family two-component system sensor kinase Cph1
LRLHTREVYPDTDIGLAMGKKIIGSHRGRVWVESELGQGAAFYFTIPKGAGD